MVKLRGLNCLSADSAIPLGWPSSDRSSMGFLTIGFDGPADPTARRLHVVFHCDYGELGGPPIVELLLGCEYGQAAAAVNARIAGMFNRWEEIVLVDVAGELWEFHRDTVRAFAVVDQRRRWCP